MDWGSFGNSALNILNKGADAATSIVSLRDRLQSLKNRNMPRQQAAPSAPALVPVEIPSGAANALPRQGGNMKLLLIAAAVLGGGFLLLRARK